MIKLYDKVFRIFMAPNGAEGGENPESKKGSDDGANELGAGGKVVVPEFLKDAPEPLQKSKSLAKFKSAQDVFASYIELEGKLGKSVEMPGPDANAETWGKFFSRIGRPETTEGYEIPAGKLDASFEKTIRSAALVAGLNKAQAKIVAESMISYNESVKAAQALAREQAGIQQDQVLKSTFGDQLVAVMEKANKAFNLIPATAQAKIKTAGLSKDPEIIHFFASLADEMGEDVLVRGNFVKEKVADPYDWMREKGALG